MLKKVLLFVLLFLSIKNQVNAQQDSTKLAGDMKPAFQHLLLELSTTYFTVVKENQVDLDSSLIHVSHSLSLSRLSIVAEGIKDDDLPNNTQWIDIRKPWIGKKQLNYVAGEKHAELCILLGAYFAFEPGSDKKANDSSLDYLSSGIRECAQLNDLNLKLVGERLLAKLYLKTGKFDEADKLFATVIDGFTKAGDKYAVAATYSWWGLYMPVTAGSTSTRIQHTEISLDLFKSLNDQEGQINALINDCYLHLLKYDPVTAEKIAKQAVSLTAATDFPYAHYVTGALVTTTMFQGQFGEPLTYAIQTIETAERMHDHIPLPYFYGIVAGLYSDEGNREDIAIDWEKKSVNAFLNQHENNFMAQFDLVTMLLDAGRQAEALTYIKRADHTTSPGSLLDTLYYNLTLGSYNTDAKNWVAAHKFLDNALLVEKKIEQHGLNVRKPQVLISLADLNYREGNYKQAKLYYEQYLSLPTLGNGGLYGGNAVALQNLLSIDSINGDKQSELEDYKRYTDAIIRNYKVSKIMLAEELQVKYATTERINQIKLLNQKSKLEQANLTQAHLINNITIIGTLLVIVIAALLYRQSKIRKKNNGIITKKNELMQQLLDEKEWLLKEVHHRVKNNLHTIICLLESQAAYLDNDALKAIENSQHRIYAMSLIHQKLYQSEDIKVINMNLYLSEFVQYLEDSFGSPGHINVILQAENIKLSAGQAVPTGLIINEAVNNSFKYAFPNQRKGEIAITLKKIGDDIFLSVKDNGIGFKRADDQETNSLGLELINGLAIDLNGEIKFDTENGTIIELRYSIDHVGIPANEENLSALR